MQETPIQSVTIPCKPIQMPSTAPLARPQVIGNEHTGRVKIEIGDGAVLALILKSCYNTLRGRRVHL